MEKDSGPHRENILTVSGRKEERSEESWTYNRAETLSIHKVSVITYDRKVLKHMVEEVG